MLSAGTEVRSLIAAGARPLFKATLTLADGAVRELVGDDLMGGTLSISQSTSPSSTFAIGGAVIGSCDLTLNNWDGRFDDYDFAGATLVPYVGYRLSNGNTSWLRKGVYGIEQPDSYGTAIGLTALDNLRLLQRPYSEVGTAYPATLATIVREACEACGVTLATPAFANRAYSVSARPDGSTLSCLDVIAYAAQASGNWVRCDEWGRVTFGWYDQGAAPLATLTALNGLSVSTDDVVVTGVRVTASDEVNPDGTRGADGETSLSGAEGYVLAVADNPLVAYGRSATVAAQLASRVVGLTFRPFSSAALGDPTLEPGDAVALVDPRGRSHFSYLTAITYRLGSRSALACSAETPARNSATAHGALARAIMRNRQDVKREVTAREQAISDLAGLISDSTGLFLTKEAQQDGSTVFYLHDQATLAASAIIWKLTANALAVSTDGGQTWPYGFSVDGAAILSRIYAIGLDADYIKTGRLAVTKAVDGAATTLLEADVDTGAVTMRSLDGRNYINLLTGEVTLTSTAKVGDTAILAALNAKVTGVDVEYRLSDSATSLTGNYSWSTVAPKWIDGKYMWQRTKTVTAAGTSYSDATCIAGATGPTGATGTGVSAVVEQYYLSTSSSTQSGGSWQQTCPAYVSGRHYWTRSKITWTDDTVTYTAPTLANGLNNANSTATTAKSTADAAKNTADGVRGDLDTLATQQGVLDALTDGGRSQGIYLQDGQLYVNGEYLKANSVSGNLITGGAISDAAGRNVWDLTTGALATSGMFGDVIYVTDRVEAREDASHHTDLNATGLLGTVGTAGRHGWRLQYSEAEDELVLWAQNLRMRADGALSRGSAAAAPFFGWDAVATATGTEGAGVMLAGYGEAMVVAAFDGKICSATLPVSALSPSTQELWLGGGRGASTAGYPNTGLRAVCAISTLYFAGVETTNGGTVATAGTTWTVYAR